MKGFFLIFTIISFFFASSTYALDAPKELRATSSSDTSISLDWLDVEGSVGYYLYYGENTGSGGAYEVEGVNLIEESEYTLEGLESNKKYYLAVTSVDTLSTESSFSNELEYMTLTEGSQNTVSSLRIERVDIIDSTSIEMVFSKDIDASGAREFILQEQNSGLEIPISVSEVSATNPKKIISILESPLKETVKYKLTVLDIRDTDGGNISAGIDAFTNFVVPTFREEKTPEMNSAGPVGNIGNNEKTPENNKVNNSSNDTESTSNSDIKSEKTSSNQQNKNSEEISSAIRNNDNNMEEISQSNVGNAGKTVSTTKNISKNTDNIAGNAGTTVSSEDLSKNTAGAASNNTKLPKTGAEHWILALLAIMISAGIYYRTKK